MHRIEAQPGSALIFTEKLLHGTLPWQGGGERRTLFYKFVPYGYHNRDVEYDVGLPSMAASRRQIMGYPAAGEWFTPPWFGVERWEEGRPWRRRLDDRSAVGSLRLDGTTVARAAAGGASRM